MTKKRIELSTFGFKYGQPQANYYFDVTFLKNPAREPNWDLFSTPCAQMINFVLQQESAQKFIEKVIPLIDTICELDDGCRVALGCNSGRHRSVILANHLAVELQKLGCEVKVKHRDQSS